MFAGGFHCGSANSFYWNHKHSSYTRNKTKLSRWVLSGLFMNRQLPLILLVGDLLVLRHILYKFQ